MGLSLHLESSWRGVELSELNWLELSWRDTQETSGTFIFRGWGLISLSIYLFSLDVCMSVWFLIHFLVFRVWRLQYYRQSRMKALKIVYPDMADEEETGGSGRMSYPRPISEPPSPSSSRATTPAPSDDEVDSEGEVSPPLTLSPAPLLHPLSHIWGVLFNFADFVFELSEMFFT